MKLKLESITATHFVRTQVYLKTFIIIFYFEKYVLILFQNWQLISISILFDYLILFKDQVLLCFYVFYVSFI